MAKMQQVKMYTNYKTMYEYNATRQNVFKLQNNVSILCNTSKCIQMTKRCMAKMQQVKMCTNYKTMYAYNATRQNVFKLQNNVWI